MVELSTETAAIQKPSYITQRMKNIFPFTGKQFIFEKPDPIDYTLLLELYSLTSS